jgi:hypothetical protein
LDVPEIRQAFEELRMVTQSERDRARYEERFKAELDARSFQKVSEETGVRKGLKQGVLIGRVQQCQRTLGEAETLQAELEKWALVELEQLVKRLEQQIANTNRSSGIA